VLQVGAIGIEEKKFYSGRVKTGDVAAFINSTSIVQRFRDWKETWHLLNIWDLLHCL
jgi:hypothetical protein